MSEQAEEIDPKGRFALDSLDGITFSDPDGLIQEAAKAEDASPDTDET